MDAVEALKKIKELHKELNDWIQSAALLEESTKKPPPIELYIVGQWIDTGPGYNDCIFEAGYVTSDLDKAKEAAGGTVGNHIMRASDGSYFHDWEQGEI